LATFLSGMAEPLGALIGGTLLVGASNEAIGLALAFAGGVMTYITADELILWLMNTVINTQFP